MLKRADFESYETISMPDFGSDLRNAKRERAATRFQTLAFRMSDMTDAQYEHIKLTLNRDFMELLKNYHDPLTETKRSELANNIRGLVEANKFKLTVGVKADPNDAGRTLIEITYAP